MLQTAWGSLRLEKGEPELDDRYDLLDCTTPQKLTRGFEAPRLLIIVSTACGPIGAGPVHDWARSWAFDLKAGVDQSLDDDFSRGLRIRDRHRKVVAVEKVNEHVLGSELADGSFRAIGHHFPSPGASAFRPGGIRQSSTWDPRFLLHTSGSRQSYQSARNHEDCSPTRGRPLHEPCRPASRNTHQEELGPRKLDDAHASTTFPA
jgi:hypothetical protein